MIDIALIKENYSRMSDEQLIHLAQTEGQDLTSEALPLLHEEFLNRKLDTTIFGTLDDNKKAQQKRNIQEAQNNASNEFIKSIWTYAFNEKKKGTTDEEIRKGIIERGLDEEHSSLIIKTLESKAKEVLDIHDSDMLRGGLVFAVGFIITVWTYSSAINGGTYFIAWGAIIFGAIRFFRGLSNKGKYKTILENIEGEHSVETITE